MNPTETIDLQYFCAEMARNAAVIEALLSETPEEQCRWKPEEGKWAMIEVINHLADEEIDDFKTRLRLTLVEPNEAWPPIEPEVWAVERDYISRDMAESLTRFIDERKKTVSWLSQLVQPEWENAYQHPLAKLTAGDLMKAWLAHDYLHIRQLVRLKMQYLESQAQIYTTKYAGTW